MRRRDGNPLWIDERSAATTRMRRIDLRSVSSSPDYDEEWLQLLLHNNPGIIPTEQIEPGFGRAISVCCELPLSFGAGRSGALDNFFITPEGRLLLVETKLWRNPEARRSVIAQIMEYAAAMFRLSYEQLQSAVLSARGETKEPNSLHAIISQQAEDIGEEEFIDAVSRNLSRGRAIIAVAGDGIREDIAPMAELLQTHAGHRFTFALIELGIYETPQSNVRVVVPSVLAQTALIERGVVQIEDRDDGSQRITIKEPTLIAGRISERSFGIAEDEFYELIDKRTPGLSAHLKSFLTKADTLGVYPDMQGGLNLKHTAPSGNPLNLGTIDKGGFFDTGPATWWERKEAGRRYNNVLALKIGGIVRENRNGETAVRTAQGKMPRLSEFLPVHEDAWLAAIESYIREIFDAAEEG